nr:vitrin [Loxodonta africana]
MPVTLTQVPTTTAAKATHTFLPKASPSAASTTGSPRPQPIFHRSQEPVGPELVENRKKLEEVTPTLAKLRCSWRGDRGFGQQPPRRPAFLLHPCPAPSSMLTHGLLGKYTEQAFQAAHAAIAKKAAKMEWKETFLQIVLPSQRIFYLWSTTTYTSSHNSSRANPGIQRQDSLGAAFQKPAGVDVSLGRALSFVTKNFFSKANGNRGGAPNVAVVMVDGWPTDKVEEASRLARESGINIFFITIEGAIEKEKQYVIEPNFANKAVCRTNGFYSLNVQSWFSLHKTLQPLVKRVCDSDRLACSKTCFNSADIGFVIDGSSSVGTSNFRTVLQFVANLSKEFEISDTDTRIGAVQYTYEQRLEFGFDQYSSKPDILNAIKRVGYWSGGTSTGAAINYALEQLFKKSKPNKRKLMVLITDGRSYDDVRIPAMAAHQKGVITYAIGIAWAAQDELEVIATHPARDHSFFVDEFDHLYRFVPRVIQNICTEFNSRPRN